MTAGWQEGSLSRLDLQPAELVTSLTMWETSDPGGGSSGLGRIRITTNMGQIFDHGSSDIEVKAVQCSPESGIIIGFGGATTKPQPAPSELLVSLQYRFLARLKSVSVDEVDYQNDPFQTATGISPISLSHATFANSGATPIDYEFSDSITRSNTSEYSVATAEKYGVSATVSAEFFGISAGASPTWEKSTEKTQTTTTSLDITLQWTVKGSVPPNGSVSCTATCSQGIINVDFTCRITLVFQDTTIPSVTITSQGFAKDVCYRTVSAGVDPATPPPLTLYGMYNPREWHIWEFAQCRG